MLKYDKNSAINKEIKLRKSQNKSSYAGELLDNRNTKWDQEFKKSLTSIILILIYFVIAGATIARIDIGEISAKNDFS
jgi:hypothetical protein